MSQMLWPRMDRGTARTFLMRGEPKKMGPVTVVSFEDTCGNLIMRVQG
ncbi:hypothetical protein [Pyxidicoccus fallax]|nr:hypothetical protein [Pyxidicoccus fallax]